MYWKPSYIPAVASSSCQVARSPSFARPAPPTLLQKCTSGAPGPFASAVKCIPVSSFPETLIPCAKEEPHKNCVTTAPEISNRARYLFDRSTCIVNPSPLFASGIVSPNSEILRLELYRICLLHHPRSSTLTGSLAAIHYPARKAFNSRYNPCVAHLGPSINSASLSIILLFANQSTER